MIASETTFTNASEPDAKAKNMATAIGSSGSDKAREKSMAN